MTQLRKSHLEFVHVDMAGVSHGPFTTRGGCALFEIHYDA